MAYADTLATNQTRLAALAPWLSQAPGSVIMNLLQVFLSADADTNVALLGAAPGITYTTATGTALANKATDYNVAPSTGQSAGDAVVFYSQSPAASTITLPAGSTVGTTGDGVVTPQVNFTTLTAATIAAGQYVSGAVISGATNIINTTVGTAIAAGSLANSANPANLGLSVFANWTITATGTGAYSIYKNGVLVGASGAYATGTLYDSPSIIPGVALELVGSLTSGDSAFFQTQAGAQIGVPVPGSASTLTVTAALAAGALRLSTNTANVGFVAATWLITATGTGTFTLSKNGTVIQTGLVTGQLYDGVTYIPGVAFQLTGSLTNTQTATFNTTLVSTAVVCTSPGVIGNVLAGAINQVNANLAPGISVSNAQTVSGAANPNGGIHTAAFVTLGVDPDTDSAIRQKIAVRATPVNSLSNAIAAIAAVSGVYAANVLDPQLASGYVYYYACDSNGGYAGIASGTGGVAGDTGYYYIQNPVLTAASLAANVDAALRLALPAGIVPRIGSYSGGGLIPFQIVTITAISVTFSAATAYTTTVLAPLIQAAVQQYIQGVAGNATYPGLQFNQVPTVFGMMAAAQAACGNILTNFTLTSTTPAIGSASPLILYRCPSPTVTVTRV